MNRVNGLSGHKGSVRIVSLLLMSLLFWGCGGGSSVTKSAYKLVDLGVQPGKLNLASRGGPSTMNDFTIVGQLETAVNTSHPVFWTISSAASIAPQALSTAVTPNGVQFSANGINFAGQIVGDAYFSAGGALLAALWPNLQDAAINYGALSGDNFGEATAINFGGVMVGDSSLARATPVYWLSGQTTPTAMTKLTGYLFHYPSAINTSGQVVAGAFSSDFARGAAVYWSGVQATPIALPLPTGASASYANDINDSGVIVGIFTAANGTQQAAQWLTAGAAQPALPTILPLPTGFTGGAANRINSNGVVAGSISSASNSHAVIWDVSNTVKDLNNFIPTGSGMVLSEATAINDAGQIAGNMTPLSGGPLHSFLLIPQ